MSHKAPYRTFFILFALSSALLRGQILSEAVFSFPADTEAFEYDNLGRLRALASYQQLHSRYSAGALRDVDSAFSRMGMAESDIHDIVFAAAGNTGVFGLVSGTFSGSLVKKNAAQNGVLFAGPRGAQYQCPLMNLCVWFIDDSLAAFGSQSHLRAMLDVRRGFAAGLRGNSQFMALLKKIDAGASVIGIAPGTYIATLFDGALPAASLGGLFSGITLFEYSLRSDAPPSATMAFECGSDAAAFALRQALNAAGMIDHVSNTFKDVEIDSSGKIVDLKLTLQIENL